MKTFKVTGQSMYGSGEVRTWTHHAESKEELVKSLKNSGISMASATIEEVENIEIKTYETKRMSEATRKILSSPTRDELLYEMDATGVDEITYVETTGSLKKSHKTYKRSDLGEFSKKYLLDDGSINEREIHLHLAKLCCNFSNREELEKTLKTEAEKLLKHKATDANRIIAMLLDWSCND